MKNNKYFGKLALFVAAVTLSSNVVAQELNFTQTAKQADIDWYRAIEGNGVHGIGLDAALSKLKNKKSKNVVVAIIGHGVNSSHSELKSNIWINKKEIPNNGIDDDKNGYIDDVNGWNFIGLPNGKSCAEKVIEADRIFYRLESKYIPMKMDGNYVGEAKYFKDEVCLKSEIGKSYLTLATMETIYSKMVKFNETLKKKLPSSSNFTGGDFKKYIVKPDIKKDSLAAVAYMYVSMSLDILEGSSYSQLLSDNMPNIISDVKKKYESVRHEYRSDRAMVGDDLLVLKDVKGNNNVVNNESRFSSATAGIITRVSKINGVTPVKFMGLRIVAGLDGEPHDKDLSNAIRYAVDNGADIIDILGNKSLTSNKKWLEDAVAYASLNNVLVVCSSGDGFDNINSKESYPEKKYVGGIDVTSIIRVGATDKNSLPTSFTNFGDKSVDLFAPGKDIYSCDINDNYSNFSSSVISSSMVTGVAALIKAFYPKIKPSQIKEILIKSVDSKNGIQVVTPHSTKTLGSSNDILDFGKMSVSSGIINVSKAIDMAEKIR